MASVGLSPPPPAPPVCTELECGPMFAIGVPYNWNLTANGTNNSEGGCSAPGPGEVEYCVLLNMEPEGGSYSTSGLGIDLQTPDWANASFRNVTLIGLRPGVLATYTETGGWVAGTFSLPIRLNDTMNLVLNAGEVPPTDYTFRLEFLSGGICELQLP